MKKINLLYTGFCLLLLLSSCKKGEDDPAFTLLSRKARLTGEWKLTEGKITVGIKDSSGAYAAYVYNLGASKYTILNTNNGFVYEGDCKLNLSIAKNGAIVIKQLMDSLSFDAVGTWDFEGKVGESKNKERVNVQLNTMTNSSFYRLFNKAQPHFMYRIKELRNSKLVLVCKEEMIELDSSAGIYITSEYTFSQ